MNRNNGNGQGHKNGHGQGGGRGYHNEGKELGTGGGRGKNNGGSFGTGGYCVCSKCNTKVEHIRGVKCTTIKCPECGHTMIREELLAKHR